MTRLPARSFTFYTLVALVLSILGLNETTAQQTRDPQPVLAAQEIRVMSFNIRYGTASDGDNHWDQRKDRVAATVQAFQPDLLGTQETLDFQKTFLGEKLPAYTHIGVGRDDGSERGEMTAIFFKTDRFERLAEGHFWLSETPAVPGSKSWDSSLPRIASWVKLNDRRFDDSRPILFINTHFDHRGNEARIQSARLIVEQAETLGVGCDVVITGDFNAGEGSVPYQILFANNETSPTQSRLIDTFLVAGKPDPRGQATFSAFRADVFGGNRIDWIAVSPSWGILQAVIDRTATDGRAPSDHYPVTAVLAQAPATYPDLGK